MINTFICISGMPDNFEKGGTVPFIITWVQSYKGGDVPTSGVGTSDVPTRGDASSSFKSASAVGALLLRMHRLHRHGAPVRSRLLLLLLLNLVGPVAVAPPER